MSITYFVQRVISCMILTFLLSGDSLSNLLYRAMRFANFKAILGFSVLSIILADLSGNTWLPKRVQKVMVCDLLLVDFNSFGLFLFFKAHCL